MIKNSYLKELAISGICSRKTVNKKPDVLKIQSWLNLYAQIHPAAGTATGIDGDFGPATETAVKNYQKANSLPQTGVVDIALFTLLSQPLSKAFNGTVTAHDLRERVVKIANLHLQSVPYELIINKQPNSGPWVRSYMDGYEGTNWLWCMGFVQTIIDQAASQENKSFKTLMPQTYSCDVIAQVGKTKNLFIPNKEIRKDPSLVKPGDIFLLPKSNYDWYHTGLVVAVGDGFFETIEGNTNTDGSSNGNGVYKRTRNFSTKLVDVFSIQPLV